MKLRARECVNNQEVVVALTGSKVHQHVSRCSGGNLYHGRDDCNRLFTRLTNAFSKKWEKHCHALSPLGSLTTTSARPHKTLMQALQALDARYGSCRN